MTMATTTTTTVTTTTTTTTTAWHWREALDPEQAHRQQLLKIDKHIPFAKWLKNKRREERKRRVVVVAAVAAHREGAQRERLAKDKERKETKRRQREDARVWQEAQRARAQADAQRKEAAKEKAKRMKAHAERVNRAYTDIMRSKLASVPRRPTFKEWSSRKKREGCEDVKMATEVARGPAPRESHESTTQDARSAYDTWLKRKQQEDRLKAKIAREAKARRAEDAKALHAQTWQKKAVVCAYSQNRRSEKQTQHWRAVTLLS